MMAELPGDGSPEWILAGSIYLLVVNSTGLFMMRYDKGQSRKRGSRRVPEKRLFTIALLGGSLGAWMGMRFWRHKTKHKAFVYGLPLLFLFNIIAIWVVYQLSSTV